MKKTKLITLLSLLTMSMGLISCSSKKEETHEYNDKIIYNDTVYEPLDIAYQEDSSVYVSTTDLLGVSKGVKAAEWDNYDIKLRVKYSNGFLKDFDLKIKNIPLDMRHYLGEVGKQHIYLIEYKWVTTHEFEIIENPDWHGYQCEFFDKDKKYLTTQTVGYYQEVTYQGPELPKQPEDYDYKYNFLGWNHSTKYIHQDMQFLANYQKSEKRFYANKPYNRDYIGLSSLINADKSEGSSLMYLGRVRHVAAFYTEAQELIYDDLEFSFHFDEFGKYWNQYNADIVKYAITYQEDSDYSSYIYGNPHEILNNPTFAFEFNQNYQYTGVNAYLDDEVDVKLSSINPYDGVVNEISSRINPAIKMNVSKREEKGFYRFAIVLSFDIYLSITYTKLADHTYEIGVFHDFIIAPVKDSTKSMIQYSVDGDFGNEVEDKLVISSKGLYYCAEMIDWSK